MAFLNLEIKPISEIKPKLHHSKYLKVVQWRNPMSNNSSIPNINPGLAPTI